MRIGLFVSVSGGERFFRIRAAQNIAGKFRLYLRSGIRKGYDYINGLIKEFVIKRGDGMREKQTVNMNIKEMNRTNIYQLLRQQTNLSRQDISRILRLSLPTVIQNLEEMQTEGLVRESGTIGNTGGRRAKSYDIVTDARIAVGIDITKNHITVLAVDLDGKIIARVKKRAAFQRTDEYYRYLATLVEDIVGQTGCQREAILGVGIGVPGLITKDNQEVFYGKILNFTGARQEEFSRYMSYPAALYNDANAAGYAETWLNHSEDNVFYLMLSNNVGGAVIINGQVYTGRNLQGGEVGHIKIHAQGKPCYCGQKGCVDAYCSASQLSELTGGNLEEFFQALARKEEDKAAVWEKYLDDLALTINYLMTLFDCTVILGGYVGKYLEPYLEAIRERLKRLSSFEYQQDAVIVCRYKEDAIAAGAALNYIEAFIDSI